MTATHLGQLQLTRSEFQDIFTLRSLIRDGNAATDQEWLPVLSDFLKAKLQQQYGAWLSEEATAHITLSPFFFLPPAPQPLTFPPQPSTDDDPAPLFTKAELQRWRNVLSDRIAQLASVNQDQADMIDRVEQAVLGGLRDALVGVYGEAAGFTGRFAEALSDRLLFDFADNPTNKTTRVSQAIATLQLLLFSLRHGNLFRLAKVATSSLYPQITLQTEHFDTEWQWLGSYGSWRSALFIFMYPENLLYPTLRDTSEQSQPFKDIVDELRSGGPVTPSVALDLGDRYGAFFDQLKSLTIQASCLVKVPVSSGSSSTQELCLVFGSKKYAGAFWSSRVADLTVDAKHTLWNPIPGWDAVQRILGAVPSHTKSGQHRVSVIAQLLDKHGNPILQVQNFDLDFLLQGKSPWTPEPKTLGDLPISPRSDHPSPTVVVEQYAPTDGTDAPKYRSPHVYVGVMQLPSGGHTSVMDVYRRPLNDDATDWAGSDWLTYKCDTVVDCDSLIAGFSTSANALRENPTDGYQGCGFLPAKLSSHKASASIQSLLAPTAAHALAAESDRTQSRTLQTDRSRKSHPLPC